MKPRLLPFRELESVKGIPFCRQHIHRLVKDGQFPAPVKLGPATNAWLEDEVDAWLEARIEASLAGRRADPKLAVAIKENMFEGSARMRRLET